MHFYKGDRKVAFYFFSNINPSNYLPSETNIKYYFAEHKNWVAATNSKFLNIVSIEEDLKNEKYVFYFDADTNIDKEFTEEWFLGDMVGGEHSNNNSFPKPFDRNPASKAYVPLDTSLSQVYYYGAIFGGSTKNMIAFCKQMINNQLEDKKINYEPGVNDESYINQYFHYNPPSKSIDCKDFKFLVSDKGGLGEMRNPNLNVEDLKRGILENRNVLWNIQNNKLILGE